MTRSRQTKRTPSLTLAGLIQDPIPECRSRRGVETLRQGMQSGNIAHGQHDFLREKLRESRNDECEPMSRRLTSPGP